MNSSVSAPYTARQVRAALGFPDHIGSSAAGLDALRLIAAEKAAIDATEAEIVAELRALRAAEDTARGVRNQGDQEKNSGDD